LYDFRSVGAVGMLFIFGRNSTWCFWMRDTPLRIVWISGSRAAQEALVLAKGVCTHIDSGLTP